MSSGTKDFNLELFLRAKYLPKFIQECGHIRVRDLCVIFDNAQTTEQVANLLSQRSMLESCKVFEKLRKIEFSHSPFMVETEYKLA